eukprot:TRINITY_DN33731_c0_g1_i2.p1 TRINITY_DN33731_c0_g1~~TRINITY_DN33731_c0_g1_i2.p1  ORF type:complete len:101 (+),score=25.24 TRINITY_DN33731_c0_g1_i2:80-382(+)
MPAGASSRLLRAAGALTAAEPGVRKGGTGGYEVFVSRDGGEPRAVEVQADATVGDLREAAGVGAGDMLSYQEQQLEDPAAALADLGVGPQAVLWGRRGWS